MATKTTKMNFAGFSKPTTTLLTELAENNNRAWFLENKSRYERDVQGVALDYIAAMGPRIAQLSDYFLALPQKSGGSLMRVYKDTRFARGQDPYKTNIGIQFRHELAKDVHAPGFYVHIEPDACFIGAGMWRPEPPALAKIRQRIVEQPKQWQKVRANKAFSEHWTLGGTGLKKAPRGFAEDHPHIEDLKRKDFIAGHDLPGAAIATAQFVDLSTEYFKAAAPLMKFLCASLELNY